MKKHIALLVTVLFTARLLAQSPQTMSYQVVIRNASDQLVKTQVGMQISILQGTSTGTPVYVETQTPTPNVNGLVSIEIGGGTPVTGTFAGIDWSAGPYFIKTETAVAAPLTTYTISGTSQLLSVPYSLFAKTAGTSVDAVKLTGNQTITGIKTFNGTTAVATPVNSTDAVNKAYVDVLKTQIQEQEDMLIEAGTYKLTDIEGNQYHVVKIGTQVWMKENLKTIKYNDGTAIPNITIDATWTTVTTGAYCDYSNTPANATIYGRLYNWYAVDNNAATKVASNGGKNVCPTSWHVPTDAEWTTLTDYLTNNGYGYEGSGSDIGKSMAAISGWTTNGTLGNVGNDQASNNRSGFTALPGGFRDLDGIFYGVGDNVYWWSSTEYSATTSYDRNMSYSYNSVHSYYNSKQDGFSVRCLRDL